MDHKIVLLILCFCKFSLYETTLFTVFLWSQVPVTLLEYSISAVTEGIDAIATTRVLIRGEDSVTATQATNAYTGESVNRAFRY